MEEEFALFLWYSVLPCAHLAKFVSRMDAQQRCALWSWSHSSKVAGGHSYEQRRIKLHPNCFGKCILVFQKVIWFVYRSKSLLKAPKTHETSRKTSLMTIPMELVEQVLQMLSKRESTLTYRSITRVKSTRPDTCHKIRKLLQPRQ